MPESRYGSGSSRYCYEDTNVLINHYDIRDDRQLAAMETMLSAQRLSELQDQPIDGQFDMKHLQEIHTYLFSDLYPFAGLLREENISKDGFSFAQVKHLEKSAERIFEKLMEEPWESMGKDQLAERLAYYMAELNVLHPFREGNGRSLREFIRCLSKKAGYDLDWTRADRNEILKASIASTSDTSHLADVLQQLLVRS